MEYQTWQETALSTLDRATGVVHSQRRDLPMHQLGARRMTDPRDHPRQVVSRGGSGLEASAGPQRGGRSIWFVGRRGRETWGMGSLLPDGGIA
jgi:hypothetical protein